MSFLPRVSGRELAKALRSFGYEIDHQTGSHMILRNARSPYRRLTVPDHRELSTGTLRAIIRQAGLSVEQIKEAL